MTETSSNTVLLEDFLGVGGLAAHDAARLLLRVVELVAELHSREEVHGRIFPGAIIIRPDGEAEIASLTAAGAERDLMTDPIDYIAPEVISGDAPDKRSDVYALGLVGHTILAGRLPFQFSADTDEGVDERLYGQITPLSLASDTCPADIASSVDRATARMPENRYWSAAEMAHTLRLALSEKDDETGRNLLDARLRAETNARSRKAVLPASIDTPSELEHAPHIPTVPAKNRQSLVRSFGLFGLFCIGLAVVAAGLIGIPRLKQIAAGVPQMISTMRSPSKAPFKSKRTSKSTSKPTRSQEKSLASAFKEAKKELLER